MLEVRGVGIVRLPYLSRIPLRLVVDLVPPQMVDRMPEDAQCVLLGRRIAHLALTPFEASTPAKIRFSLAGWVKPELHPIAVVL
jgi:hypothetical protein